MDKLELTLRVKQVVVKDTRNDDREDKTEMSATLKGLLEDEWVKVNIRGPVGLKNYFAKGEVVDIVIGNKQTRL